MELSQEGHCSARTFRRDIAGSSAASPAHRLRRTRRLRRLSAFAAFIADDAASAADDAAAFAKLSSSIRRERRGPSSSMPCCKLASSLAAASPARLCRLRSMHSFHFVAAFAARWSLCSSLLWQMELSPSPPPCYISLPALADGVESLASSLLYVPPCLGRWELSR
jgi:hypothetical protein